MNTSTGTAILTSRGWLAATPPEFQQALLSISSWRRFGPGETMSQPGAGSGSLLGLAEGVAILSPLIGPPDSPAMHLAQPGQWFGFMPIVTGEEALFSPVAKTQVLCASASRSSVERMLTANPGWWRQMALLTADFARRATGVSADLMIRDSRRRLAATLLRLADCRHEAPFQLPAEACVSQSELAAISNLSRNTANQILGDLASARLIDLGYNNITLRDVTALRAIVDDERAPPLRRTAQDEPAFA